MLAAIAPARGEFSYGVAPQVRNVRAGLAATLSQPSVIVTLSGDLPTLQALAPESIVVTVDATDLGPGLYAITPQVQLPPGTTVTRVDPPQVGIGLSERP